MTRDFYLRNRNWTRPSRRQRRFRNRSLPAERTNRHVTYKSKKNIYIGNFKLQLYLYIIVIMFSSAIDLREKAQKKCFGNVFIYDCFVFMYMRV